jgi:hypothetical protein
VETTSLLKKEEITPGWEGALKILLKTFIEK